MIDSTRGTTIIPRRKRNYSGLSKRPLAIGDKVADKKPGFNQECCNFNWIEYLRPTELLDFDAGYCRDIKRYRISANSEYFQIDDSRPSGFVLAAEIFLYNYMA